MRIAMLGGGVIARLFIDHIRRGDLGDSQVIAIVGRSAAERAGDDTASRGRALATEHGIAYVTDVPGLLATKPDIVVEAASHDAVRLYAEPLLAAGIGMIVLSCGVMADDALRARMEAASRRTGAQLYVPSGGIGGLDALKAAAFAGVDEAGITVNKPPVAWKGIAYVDRLGIDMDTLTERTVLYDGPARAGVIHFPANVNIAAVLSMAGIGFDRTRLTVVAVPGLARNTHNIHVKGRTGDISITLENVPSPENPKTAWLACYSALAALKLAQDRVRYGT